MGRTIKRPSHQPVLDPNQAGPPRSCTSGRVACSSRLPSGPSDHQAASEALRSHATRSSLLTPASLGASHASTLSRLLLPLHQQPRNNSFRVYATPPPIPTRRTTALPRFAAAAASTRPPRHPRLFGIASQPCAPCRPPGLSLQPFPLVRGQLFHQMSLRRSRIWLMIVACCLFASQMEAPADAPGGICGPLRGDPRSPGATFGWPCLLACESCNTQ
jgi:hypothetical protein